MNEQLQGKLVEILAGIQAATKAAGDFALEQLPDIAQQYVAYGRVFGTLESLACLSLLILLAVVTCKFGYFSKAPDEYGFWPTPRMVAAFGGTLGLILSFILTMASFQGTLLVWIAPKVWLLKEIAGLLK